MTHKIKAKFAPILDREAELLNLLKALEDTKKTYDGSISALRKRHADIIKNRRKRLSAKFDRELKATRDLIEIENIKKLEGLYKRVAKEAEDDCVNLAITLARKVIGEAVSESRSNLKERVKNVISKLSASRSIKVIANPDEVPALYNLSAEQSFNFSLEIESDSKIEKGNARIVSPSGAVEICWRSQLDALLDVIKQNQSNRIEGATHA